MLDNVQTRYGWQDSLETEANELLFPKVVKLLTKKKRPLKVLDIGCGNGSLVNILVDQGHTVVGVDASVDGIMVARKTIDDVRFEVCSIYDERFSRIVGRDFDGAAHTIERRTCGEVR